MNGSITSGRGTIIGFPTYARVDFGVEHRFKIRKYRPWIGVRADNALSTLPAVRRAGQYLVAGVRNLLQYRVSSVPHPDSLRTVRRSLLTSR